MALEGGRRRRARRKSDIWIMAGHVPPHARDVPQGRRRLPRSDPQPDLELHESDRARPGGTGQGDERPARWPTSRTPIRRDDAAAPASCSTASRSCATTARPRRGCWIFSGCCTEKGNQMARRDATDPREHGHRAELGVGVAGQPAHPLQPRQRRSVPASRGIPAQADHRVERQQSGPASTCPTIGPTTKPSDGVGPFIMNAEGVGAAVRARPDGAKGRSPSTTSRSNRRSPNVLHPKVRDNPAARVFADDRAAFGNADGVPLCRRPPIA